MKVDAIRLDLRPRSMFEACDLGVRIVSTHARAVWGSCAPVFAFVLLAAIALYPFGVGWTLFAIFWMKPWLDRSILFVLARAVFGEPTRFRDLLLANRAVWWQGLAGSLTLRRISPWRSFVQPVLQLEGHRGRSRGKRMNVMLGNHRGAALGMQSAFSAVESAFVFGLWTLPGWLMPNDARENWLSGIFTGDSPIADWLAVVCYALAVFAVEPFFVGAGFAMYLNRRVELEAWDIEQEFRLAFAV